MSGTVQRKATAAHRKRARAKGLVRFELQVPETDAGMLRELAEKLRDQGAGADAARSGLSSALAGPAPKTVLEMFASGLPDEYFEGVFDHVRTTSDRKVDW